MHTSGHNPMEHKKLKFTPNHVCDHVEDPENIEDPEFTSRYVKKHEECYIYSMPEYKWVRDIVLPAFRKKVFYGGDRLRLHSELTPPDHKMTCDQCKQCTVKINHEKMLEKVIGYTRSYTHPFTKELRKRGFIIKKLKHYDVTSHEKSDYFFAYFFMYFSELDDPHVQSRIRSNYFDDLKSNKRLETKSDDPHILSEYTIDYFNDSKMNERYDPPQFPFNNSGVYGGYQPQ